MTKIFRGVFAVTCTPFDEAGGIDESALRRHLRWMVDEGGVHGVVPTEVRVSLLSFQKQSASRWLPSPSMKSRGSCPSWLVPLPVRHARP
jgi:hypothetical protein